MQVCSHLPKHIVDQLISCLVEGHMLIFLFSFDKKGKKEKENKKSAGNLKQKRRETLSCLVREVQRHRRLQKARLVFFALLRSPTRASSSAQSLSVQLIQTMLMVIGISN